MGDRPARGVPAPDVFVGREWLLDAVRGWVDSDEPRPLLVTGPAGSGKSAVAARLTEEASDWLLLAHVCRARDDRTLDPLRFVERLATSLSERVPGFGAAVLEQRGGGVRVEGSAKAGDVAEGGVVAGVVVRRLEIGPLAPRVAFDRLVRRPLEQVAAAAPLVVLVDALDEALTYGPGDTLVDLLAVATDAHGELPAQLRLLLTSRADDRVLGRVAHRRLDLVNDAPEGTDDIGRYARTRLRDLPEARRDDLARRVAETAKGNFLYARYVLDDLLADRERLDTGQPLSFPAGLEEHYAEYLERELTRSHERWQDRYRPLLGLLCTARGQGLTPVLLAGAADLAEDRVDDALDVLGQYLSATGDGRFRIYHESFREFLIGSEEFPVYPAVASRRLAEFLLDEFDGEWLPPPDQEPDVEHAYALAHAPAHLAEAAAGAGSRRDRRALAARLGDLLVDFGFLQGKATHAGVFALLEDLSSAPSLVDPGSDRHRTLGLVAELVRYDLQFLAAHPEALLDRCWQRGWWYDAPEAAAFYDADQKAPPWERDGERLCELVERWRAELERRHPGRRWLRALRPPPDPLGSPQRAVLRGHDDELKTVDVSADETRIVSAGGDGMRLWDTATGALLAFVPTREEEEEWLGAACFSPDGATVAAGSSDGSVRLCDATRLTEQCRSERGPESVSVLRYTPDGALLVVGDWGGRIRILDATTLAELHREAAHQGIVTAVATSPAGDELASGEQNFRGPNRLRLWALAADGALTPRDDTPSGAWVEDIAYSPDGGILAWALYSGEVRLRDRATGALRSFRPHGEEPAGCVAFLPSGDRLVTGKGGAFGTAPILIWDVAALAPVGELRGHVFGVSAVRVLQDGRALISAGDATIRRWSLDAAALGLAVRGVEPEVNEVVFTPNGKAIVTASEDSEIAWARAVDDGAVLGRFDGHEGGVHALAVAGGSDVVAVASGAGPVRLWPIGGNGAVVDLVGHTAQVSAIAFSRDDRRVVTGSNDGTARVFDVDTGAEHARFRGHGERTWVHAVAFSPAGDRCASAAYAGRQLCIWDAASGGLVNALDDPPTTIFDLLFADDGSLVAEARADDPDGIAVWDASTGRRAAATGEHRWAFARAKGHRRDRWRWTDAADTDATGRAGEPELTLHDAATGEAVAWLPIPYAAVHDHPSGRIWALHRGTWLFVVALEEAGPAPI